MYTEDYDGIPPQPREHPVQVHGSRLYRRICGGRATVICIGENDDAWISAEPIEDWKDAHHRIPRRMKLIGPQQAINNCKPVASTTSDCVILNGSWFAFPRPGVIQGDVRASCGGNGLIHNPNRRFTSKIDLPSGDYLYGSRLTASNCYSELQPGDRSGRNIAYRQNGRWCFLVTADNQLTRKQVCDCLFTHARGHSPWGPISHSVSTAVQLDGGSSAKLCFASNGRVQQCPVQTSRNVATYLVICAKRSGNQPATRRADMR
jgi:hypothetical protein